MEQIIDWKLKSNKKTIINKKNVICDYVINKKITFVDEFGTHVVDLVNKVYEKDNEGIKMSIDFKKLICNFYFETGEKIGFDIKGSFKVLKDEVKINYLVEDESKEIIIEMKGKENEGTIN